MEGGGDFESMMNQVAEWIKNPTVKLWRGTGSLEIAP